MEQKVLSADGLIAAQIERGDSSAEAVMYERYSHRVYYLALSELRSREDAEDVCTETFMRVIHAIRNHQLRSGEALPAFIVGTAHNVIRENIRKRRKVDQLSQREIERAPAREPDAFFLNPDVKRAIAQVIDRLKPRERAFLRMYYYEDLAPKDIAHRLNLKEERLRLIKSRALKHFREVYLRLVKT